MNTDLHFSINTIEDYFDRLWPILRSITGPGVRETHEILSEILPLERIEIPSGTQVFDWTVPKEWKVNEAYVITPSGEKILDVNKNNLHLLNYSISFKGEITKEELDQHLYSLPDIPEAIPYLVSYYKPRWGFCISDNQRRELANGIYKVVVDTELFDGSLTISEAVLPGQSEEEILFSTYTCHPSMANNELSGPLTTAFLYRLLAAIPNRRYTYRFVFLPETIGSIAYLSIQGESFKKKLRAGWVVTCIGDRGPFTFKQSRKGDTLTDRVTEYVLGIISNNNVVKLDATFNEFIQMEFDDSNPCIIPFFPDDGSDERQYCSPGFNLPVGSIMRTMYGKYNEYHTSLDNKDYISFEAIMESIYLLFNFSMVLEKNITCINLIQNCEPQLGKRELYPTLGASKNIDNYTSALLWILNMSDGENDLLTIAKKSRYDIQYLFDIVGECVSKGIMKIQS